MKRMMRPEKSGIDGVKDICSYVSKDGDIKLAVEVGSYLGESTVVFGEYLKNLETLYAIDPYDLNFNYDNVFFDAENLKQVEADFLETIKKFPKIKHIKKNSESASKDFDNETLDFVYIDACHDFECVHNDIKLWKPKIKMNGYMGFHDIDRDVVKNAISVFFDLTQGYRTQDNSITFKIKN